MKKVVTFLVIIVFLFLSIGGYFFFSKDREVEMSGKIKIVTSIFPVRNIVEKIAKDSAEVVQIVPSGASPHTYEPSPSDQIKVQESDIVFLIGLEFDHYIEEMIHDNDVDAKIVEVNSYMELLDSEHDHEEEIDVHEEEEAPGKDPHYFNSINGAKAISQTVYEELSRIAPENKSFYENNYEEYLEELEELLTESQTMIGSLDRKEIITFHDAFAYMSEELGFEVLTTIEPFPGKEPTIAYLAEVGDIIEKYQVNALFSEPQLSDAVVKGISEDYGVTIYTLDPLGGNAERESFSTNYEENVATLYQALRK